MPMTKEEKKEYNRLHYLKNKEERKEYNRLYQIKHSEKIKEERRLYRIKNKKKMDELHKLWILNNKEHIKEYSKEYHKSEKGKKIYRIADWKRQGILCFDWNLLYDIFLSTNKCEICEVKQTTDRYTTKTTRCLDHDHSINDRFNVRYVLCHSCNVKLR